MMTSCVSMGQSCYKDVIAPRIYQDLGGVEYFIIGVTNYR